MKDAVADAERLIDEGGIEEIVELCERGSAGVVPLSNAAVAVIPVTDDNREQLLQVAMSMYLGECCAYCKRVYTTLDDLEDTVWQPHNQGRLACKVCWDNVHSNEKGEGQHGT